MCFPDIDYSSTAHNDGVIRFIVPVNGLSQGEATEKLKELMKLYKEEIYFNDDLFIGPSSDI